MLQYYLRAEGLMLSWVGTGRLIFSLDYTAEEYGLVQERLIAAALKMRDGGWWWQPDIAQPRRALRRQLARELCHMLWRAWLGSINSPRSRKSGAL
jgi:glutamate-1-semialdehyde 2,1-aminomutase